MPLRYVDTKNSVLFLGSGFSKFATNILNETLPDGQELFKKLSDILNADVNGYDLKSISDMLMDEKKESIFDVLYKTFTVARTSNFQHAILSLPWGRIYTTNYDDIIQNIKGSEFKCFTFYDDVPKKLPKSFSIYLHGSISRVNEEDFSDKIILNNSSYDSINREHIQWLDEFKSDIRNFNACFFLGYSLRDHHISSLLSLSLKDTKKVCFIAGKNAPKHFIKRAAEYGEVLPIDFDVFAKKIKEAPTPEKPQDLNKLPSFRYLHPGLDSKSHSTPTPTEINNLVCFGTFYKERFFSLKDIKDFVIIRKRKVDDVIKHLSDKKTILIHSRIGNGKTIFLYIFTYMVKSFSYHCLFWKGRNRCFSQELELIKKYNKVIVIFDDYDEAINNIEKISSEAPDVKFIVTMRTSLQEVRLHEIKEKLPSPLQRIDINTLSSEEKNDFYNLLYKNGAQKQNLEHSIKNKSRDIRDIVTKLYEHKEIRKKILNICDSLSSTLRETVIILSLAKWSGITVDDSTINYILKKDVFLDIKDPNNHSINDLIEFNEEKIDMRSSMLSEYIIQHMLDTDHVLNICQKIIICLTNKKHKNNYRKFSRELVKFSTFKHLFKHKEDYIPSLEKHYQILSQNSKVNDDPLFWLQYAIFMKINNRIEESINFLTAGYARAKNIKGFKSYQLDTQALSIFLLKESNNTNRCIDNFDRITHYMNIVVNMIEDESHRHYALVVIDEIPDFLEKRGEFLTKPQTIRIIAYTGKVIKILQTINPDTLSPHERNIVNRLEKEKNKLIPH